MVVPGEEVEEHHLLVRQAAGLEEARLDMGVALATVQHQIPLHHSPPQEAEVVGLQEESEAVVADIQMAVKVRGAVTAAAPGEEGMLATIMGGLLQSQVLSKGKMAALDLASRCHRSSLVEMQVPHPFHPPPLQALDMAPAPPLAGMAHREWWHSGSSSTD